MFAHIERKHKGFLYFCICILTALVTPFGITVVIQTFKVTVAWLSATGKFIGPEL
jgi:hypothetical protein